MKANFKSILMLVIIVALVIASVSMFSGFGKDEKPFQYSDLVELFEDDLVTSFVVDGNLNMTLKALSFATDEQGEYILDAEGNRTYKTNDNGEKIITNYEYQLTYNFQLDQINRIAQQKLEAGNTNLTEYNYDHPEGTPWYQAYLPYIIVLLIFVGLWFLLMRQSVGGPGKMNSFSKSRAKVTLNDKNAVKFVDVAGADEEKAELEEVVEFLKDPEKFVKLGARIPRGVLLVGPPGTGKTLLAKAVAGEAGVPFFSISGSDFVEMYVGVGASRVRDLFDNARKTPASIIFIDEIDAVGRHRGAGLGGGHDEREQTLNQLLVEMDGFGTNSGVIVIAATNRPDILDPALLRPGRFDRQITVNYPDIKGREEILKVHCRNKPLEASVDLKEIAKSTVGFTGADLANLLNEAALLASRRNKSLIGNDDISDAFIRIIAGPKKKAMVMKESEKRNTAYHEGGHAMLAYYLDLDPVQQISIIPSGRALGYTLNPPAEDKYSVYKSELKKEIAMLLGGRAAEEIVFGDISGGASNDIERATKKAKAMVTRLGMSEILGPRCFGNNHDEVFLGRDFSSSQDFSEEIAAQIDREIHSIIAEAYDKAKEILTTNISKLHFIADFLLKNEIMDGEQFKYIMETDEPTMEGAEKIAKEKQRKSDEENKTAYENKVKEEEAKRVAEEEARIRAEEEAKKSSADPEDFFDAFWREQQNLNKSDNSSTDSKDKESDNTSDDSKDNDK